MAEMIPVKKEIIVKFLIRNLIQLICLGIFTTTSFAANESKILFIGSSTIAYWRDTIAKDFPNFSVYNEGVVGTTFPYLTSQMDSYARKYPDMKNIVVYSGDNDIALPFNTPMSVAKDFTIAMMKLHERFPEAHVFVFSIKPCPAVIIRASTETVKKTNELILTALNQMNEASSAKGEDPYLSYVDIFPKMLTADGHPDKNLFSMPLGIHLNNAGYKVWRDALTPYLYADI